MKKIFLVTAVVGALAMTGCSDFLDVKPVGVLSEVDFLTQDGLDQVITGSYARFHRGGDFGSSPSNYQYGDVMGGDANKGSAYSDQPDFTTLETYSIVTDNSYLNSKWDWCYDGVFRANTIISMANRIGDLDESFKTRAIAQARFLRGYWHFEVLKLFGANVPYVTEEDRDAASNPMISNKDESGNWIYIWDRIAEDFKFAYDNLPASWDAGEAGRANKWAAAAFLAKLYIFQSSPYDGNNGGANKWADAKTLLETIMANGVDSKGQKYRLADTYEQLWTAGESDWTGESVFDFQESISGTQTRTNAIDGSAHISLINGLGNSGWGFYQPSYEFVNAHIVDANGLPLLDKSYQNLPTLSTVVETSGGPVVKTALDTYTDPRLDVSVGRFEIPYYDWLVPSGAAGTYVREPANGGLYLNKKKMPKKADKGSLSVATSAGSSVKNFHVIRYADILLWYAEVLIETGQPAEARQYVNQVRARAAKGYVKAVDPTTMEESTSPYVLDDKVNGTTKANAAANYRVGLYPESQFATKESATKALRFERRLEISLEGMRWYDLARWGVIGAELRDYTNYEKQYLTRFASASYQDSWVTLPIPNRQLQRMPGVLFQNDRWAE